MKFTTFDLAQTVARYNAKYGTAHGLTHTFKIISLGNDVQQALQQTIDSLEVCAQNTSGALPTAQRNQVKANIYADAKKDSLQGVRANLGQMREDNRKLKAHHWYVSNQQRLKEDDLWDDFERSANDHSITGNVLFLRRWWLQQQEFGHYTSTGIWFVATSILDGFEEYQSLGSLEMVKLKRKLPAMIFDEYSAYLTSIREKIAEMKSTLCWSMLARLEVADQKGNLLFDDVIMHLAWKLESNALLKPNNGFIRSPRHGLSTELFNNFHRYILDNGSQEQKEALLKLSWFKSLKNCSLFKTDKQLLVMPKKMVQENLVPRKVYLKRIFRYQYFRYDFFNDKLSLMASLERMLRDDSHLQIAEFSTFRDFQLKLIDTAAALSMMDHHCKLWKPRGLMKLFCKSTNRFIVIWNDFSIQRHQQLLDKQVDAVLAFSRQFTARYERTRDLQDLLPLDQVYYIVDKINLLAKECRDEQQMRALRVVLNDITLLKNKALHEEKEIKPKITRVSQNKKVHIAKSEGVLETVQTLDLFSLSLSDFNQIVYSIHNAASQIEVENIKKGSAAIHNCMQSMFIQYLEYSIAMVDKSTQWLDKRLVEVGKLLEQFSEHHIVERLCALKSLRDESTSKFIYQLKCESYLYSYVSVNVDQLSVLGEDSSEIAFDEQSSATSESQPLIGRVI